MAYFPNQSVDFDSLAMSLERSSSMPLYIQLSGILEGWISSGILPPESRLPNSSELAKTINVNISTIGKAMNNLADKGLIIRRQRAGTFVSEKASMRHKNVGFYYLNEREPITLDEFEAMQEVLNGHRFDIKLIPFGWDFFKHNDIQNDIHRRDLDAAVFTVIPCDKCKSALQQLEKIEFPHVRIDNRDFEDELVSPLSTGDDAQRITQTFEKLREVGHQRIGFLGNRGEHWDNIYRSFMDDSPEFDERWRLPLSFDGTMRWRDDYHAEQIVRGYLHDNPDLTAVIVWNPVIASILVEQANMLGRSVPESLSVISLRSWHGLGLSLTFNAWSLNRRQVGKAAAQKLLTLLSNKAENQSLENTYTPWEYIDRSSIAAPISVKDKQMELVPA